jgi:hypothetical protein
MAREIGLLPNEGKLLAFGISLAMPGRIVRK